MYLAPPDPEILARRDVIIAALKLIVPDGVIEATSDLSAYENDALPSYRQRPLAVVLPGLSVTLVDAVAEIGVVNDADRGPAVAELH